MSTTARDLARLGGRGVVPENRVAALWRGGDRKLWAEGDQAYLFSGGSYRSYFYENGAGILAGIGTHGQWLWIDPASETVIVRFSAEPLPIHEELDHVIIAMLGAVATAK